MNTPVTFYGPIGQAVEEVTPSLEADPVGVYLTALSMFSAAIGGTVRVASRGGTRPVLLWSCLVAGTGRGKGTALRAAQHITRTALGRFLDTHTTSGITSGASLVNYLFEQAEATEETESGRDVRALVIEEEWSEVLRRVKRDPSFTAKLRAAWDGAPIRNTTKEAAQNVEDPALVMHTHITPSDWSRYVGAVEAGGGSYNRLLPVLLRSVPMLDDEDAQLPDVDGWDLADAYAWAMARKRTIRLTEDARPLWQTIRRYARIISESLPEEQAVFIERTAEQALRVAACLAASECSEEIDRDCLSAAFSLVRYSVQCAVGVTKGATEPKRVRPVPTLAEKVRARIAMHGGRATSSQILPYVNATTADVRALPGITVRTERNGVGRPSTVFTLTETTKSEEPAEPAPTPQARKDYDHGVLSRPSTQREKKAPAKVVRLENYRPAKVDKTAQAPAPRMAPATESAVARNPFLDLI